MEGIPDRNVRIALGDVLSRMPEWVRTDLSSKDLANRTRAEETLLAMIVVVMPEQEVVALA